MEPLEEAVKIEIDPFWKEHSEKIRRLRRAISQPLTLLGKKFKYEILFENRQITYLYTRINDIIQALIFLYEASEGARLSNDNFFYDPLNQQLLLRAFGLYVEDILKAPFDNQEDLNYEAYQKIFEGILKETNTIKQTWKKELEEGKDSFIYSDIVGTLTMILKHAAEDTGLELKLKPEEIRQLFNTQNPADHLRLKKVFEVFRRKIIKNTK